MNAKRTRLSHPFASLALLLLTIGVASCSKGASSPTSPSGAVLRVTPADGATGVRLDAPVSIDFGKTVDRSVVENGFHLIAESDMSNSCPDPTMGSHGGMDAVMANSDMLRHMGEFHSMPGHYDWNADGTSCTFAPDSLMRPQTRYMVHMSSTMIEMMQQMGGTMMGGVMNGAGDMMVHFRTVSADEHSGHH